MPFIDRLRKLDPAIFNRRCAIVAFFFLLLATSGKMIWRFHTGFTTQDFPQYYMAGVVADTGKWDALYPIPKPDSPRNPGSFEDSDLKPQTQALCVQRGVGLNEDRYMQPPPFALLMMPLGLLSYRTAFVVWNIMNCLLAWGICLLAGRVYRYCLGRATPASGWIILLIAFSPQTLRWVRVQNISAMIGCLIGIATLQLLQTHSPMRNLKSALAVWLAGLAKYIGILFVPIYLALRRWQALLWLIGISVLSVTISIAVSGWGVYHEFIHVIAPNLSKSKAFNNQSLHGFLLRVLHVDTLSPHVKLIFVIAQLLVFVALMILLFSRPPKLWQQPANLFAAVTGLAVWMMIFSPISWEHYTAYIAPFYGWMIWEATRGPIRRTIVIIALILEYVPYFMFIHLPEPLASHVIWGLVLMLGLAMWRMANPIEESDSALAPSTFVANST